MSDADVHNCHIIVRWCWREHCDTVDSYTPSKNCMAMIWFYILLIDYGRQVYCWKMAKNILQCILMHCEYCLTLGVCSCPVSRWFNRLCVLNPGPALFNFLTTRCQIWTVHLCPSCSALLDVPFYQSPLHIPSPPKFCAHCIFAARLHVNCAWVYVKLLPPTGQTLLHLLHR